MMLAIDSTTGDPVASHVSCEVVGCHGDGWRRVTVYRRGTPDFVVVCRTHHEDPDVRALMQPPRRAPIPDLEQLAAPDAMPRPRPGRASSPLLSMVEGGARASTQPRQGGTMPTTETKHPLPLVRKARPIAGMCAIEDCTAPRKARGFCSRCLERVRFAGLLDELGDPARPLRVGQFATPPSFTTDPIPEPPPAAEPDGCRPEDHDMPEAGATSPRPAPLASAPLPDLAVYALGRISDALGLVDGTEPMAVCHLTLRRLKRIAELERRNTELGKLLDDAGATARALQAQGEELAARMDELSKPKSAARAQTSGRYTPARALADIPREELEAVLGTRLTAARVAREVRTMCQAASLTLSIRDERGEPTDEMPLDRLEPMWPWSDVAESVWGVVVAALAAAAEELEQVARGQVELTAVSDDVDAAEGA